MKTAIIAAALALALRGTSARAQDGTFGCVEGPEVRGGDYDSYVLTRVLSLRPACVRFRFRLDLWRSVDDPAQRGPRDRRLVGEGGLYDALIREATRAGAFVILTAGLDAANVTPAELGDAAARTRYAEAVASLAVRYRGRVRAIELEGQPNRRAEGDAGAGDRIAPGAYAAMLLAVQTRLRPLAEALRCEMPDAIVGGLYDGPAERTASSPRTWLLALYEALAADPSAAQLRAWGREPVADLGVQIYAQAQPGRSGDFLAEGAGSVLFDLDWVYRNPLRDLPRPRVWITAGAYRASSPGANDPRQLVEATSYFAAPRRMDLPIRPVVLGWSPVVEPPGACEGYGLFRDCIVDDEHTRDTFGVVGNGLGIVRPEPWARLEFTDPSVRVVAGGTATVRLRVTNAGPPRSNAPTWTGDANLFIGQPEGCPTTPAINNIPWTNLPAGSTPSALAVGARIRLAPPNPMPPTVSTVVSWTIAPPRDLAPGPWTVAARLMEGTRWFGPWATIPVEVVAPMEMDAGVIDAGGHDAMDATLDAREIAAVDVPGDVPDDVIGDAESRDEDVGAIDAVSDAAAASDGRGDARDGAGSDDAGAAVGGGAGCACAARRAGARGHLWVVVLAASGIRRRRREA